LPSSNDAPPAKTGEGVPAKENLEREANPNTESVFKKSRLFIVVDL